MRCRAGTTLGTNALLESAGHNDAQMEVVMPVRERRTRRDVDVNERERAERARSRLGLRAAKRARVRADVWLSRRNVRRVQDAVSGGMHRQHLRRRSLASFF